MNRSAWSADQQAAQIFLAPAAQAEPPTSPRKMLLARRAVGQQHRQVLSSVRACSVLQSGGPAASKGSRFLGPFQEVQHAPTGRFARYRSHAATGGSLRAFGGQSVVPWELALFLVEEMKAEMVQPGAVVYTAALAECRWAGEQRHVDYLLQEMKAGGLRIVPGIPGATDDELPPSQAPPLFGKLPEKAPGGARRTPPRDPPASATSSAATSERLSAVASGTAAVEKGAVSALQVAARTADAALATVETMWAREEHEPSAATCRAALDACAAGGQWERALSLVRDAAMVMAADDADAGAGREGVDAEAERGVSGRVEALALKGRWSEALVLVQKDAEP
ncbi:unnamed protein product [Scytosiphon promiscuus]